MRQQLINQPLTSSTRSIGRQQRRERAVLKSKIRIAPTPIRKLIISLMFLAPMGALGTLCFALVQNNLRLHQKNNELTGIANEVKTEIDVLSEEIETLQQKAGVLEDKALPEANAAKKKPANSINSRVESGENTIQRSVVERSPKPNPSILPRGGLAKTADALNLLEDAKAQVPELSKALDSAAKPLEATLAAEAAYPSGLPMPGPLEISSEFGLRDNPFSNGSYEVHEGIDFVANVGDIIAATGEGIVTLAGPDGGYGNVVTIDHGYGYETLYAHMSKVSVKVGDRVKRGQIIGHVGSTGRSSGPHLHYSLYKDEKVIDPRKLMTIPEHVLTAGSR